MSDAQAQSNPLLTLIGLGQKARNAASLDELGFLLVNDSKALSNYRQALLWSASQGVTHLSGVVIPERHSPFMQWAVKLCAHFSEKPELAFKTLSLMDLPSALQLGWGSWMPAQVWWMPISMDGQQTAGLLVADDALDEQRLPLWQEWLASWEHAAERRRMLDSRTLKGALQHWFSQYAKGWKGLHRSRMIWAAVTCAALGALPVPLTVVGQGELVPRAPTVVRAPLDGVIKEFHVSPNQAVKAGDALFNYDNELVRSRLFVAQQNLATAQAEYRQAAQSALTDARAKFQIASLVGKIQEQQAELHFLSQQVNRTTVTAPQSGVVLFDEVGEWIGKPVQTGERVVRMADPSDVELEVWINLADAVPLSAGNEVKLFLASNPLDALEAKVRWVGYEAQPRADGSYAYRVRATLVENTKAMVGAKGTARVSAARVPLIYWLLRKPLAVMRGFLLI